MKDLLRVRGVKQLNLVMPDHIYLYGPEYNPQTGLVEENMSEVDQEDFEERLQVLKGSIDAKALKRLARKDFPTRTTISLKLPTF